MSTYCFSLSLKASLALLSGFTLLAVLVFFSGVIVGFTAQEPVASAPAPVAPVLTAAGLGDSTSRAAWRSSLAVRAPAAVCPAAFRSRAPPLPRRC